MLSINKVMLAGRLTHDPKVRVLKTGTSVADIGLAVNERIKTKEGTWDQKTLFVDAVCWGKQAETIGKYMKKGSGILVEGALQMDTWTSK
ncbi:MAG: single-stranded DNA-binding protein, partial [Spartobacteria bacterium]|nr:single-stranded DNA-binding protein [Spartobacteria bacterium]